MNHFSSDWQRREATAESMIPLIGRLYREHHVVTSIYGRPLINRSVIDLIKAHRFVQKIEQHVLSVEDTFPILQILMQLNLGPARIDIGKLAVLYKKIASDLDQATFVRQQLSTILNQGGQRSDAGTDVVLYGFGRIGRLVARLLIERAGGGQGLNLRAIVVRPSGAENDLHKRASLLRRDSIHGPFAGTLTVDDAKQRIIANGVSIQVIYADAPAQVDYRQYGIDQALVVDNTGKWRDEDGLSQHLSCPGVAKVLLTAPGKGDIKNIVYGVNHHQLQSQDRIISAASCTTNAITPVLKVLHDKFGILCGHVETVHAYTNDQNLTDNYHKGARRGRSAALNMVLAETGAASAVAKVLPDLAGKLTGSAIRVPVPNVSMAILNLNLNVATDRQTVNEHLRYCSLYSGLQKQIDYVNSSEVVSSDFVGSRHAGIVDSTATIVEGNRCIIYVWYDNEFGYSCQVNRIMQYVSGVMHPVFP